MLPILMVTMLDMALSALVGFIHGGVLGYFVGILNALAFLSLVMTCGYIIGETKGFKKIREWAAMDDKLIKETEKEFKNESEHN